MSSAISFFERTMVVTAGFFCAFCFFNRSVSFYIAQIHQHKHQSPRNNRAHSDFPSIPMSSSRELLLFLTLPQFTDCSSASARSDLHPRTSLSVLAGFDRHCRCSSCIHHCHASPNANDRIHPRSIPHCLYEAR